MQQHPRAVAGSRHLRFVRYYGYSRSLYLTVEDYSVPGGVFDGYGRDFRGGGCGYSRV